MTTDDARRFLLENLQRDLLRLRSQPLQDRKHREQTRRDRLVKIRARRLGQVPYRPHRWLGRRPTRAERSMFLAALRDMDGGPVKLLRGPRGHVKAIALTYVHLQAEADQ